MTFNYSPPSPLYSSPTLHFASLRAGAYTNDTITDISRPGFGNFLAHEPKPQYNWGPRMDLCYGMRVAMRSEHDHRISSACT